MLFTGMALFTYGLYLCRDGGSMSQMGSSMGQEDVKLLDENGILPECESSTRISSVENERMCAAVIGFARHNSEPKVPEEGTSRPGGAFLSATSFARLTLDALSEWIAILDKDGVIIDTNRAWFSAANAVHLPFHPMNKGTNYLTICEGFRGESAVDVLAFCRGIRDVISGKQESFFLEYTRQESGAKRWYIGEVTRFFHDGSANVVVAHRDITSFKKADMEIEWLAYHDSLTSLPNRHLFNDRLEQSLAQADRINGISALLFFDLDSFKVINDTLGHASGDSLLKAVARRLGRRVRKSDTLARLGGDEFVVILNRPHGGENIAVTTRDMLDSLSLPFELDGEEVFVSASVGIALYPADGNNAETLLRNADIAMYHAKIRGRNSFLFYQREMNHKAHKRLELETALRRALEKKEFVLHYQPWLDLASGALSGMEALLRWQRPGVGMVSPAEFIPVAEETGLIIPIGEWVLRTACKQIKELHALGFPGMRIAVNVSGRQLRHCDLAELVTRMLEETGINPGSLELELTESSIMENSAQTVKILQEIRTMGVKLAIDDFGTGYSSLSYLNRFPIDKIKIDRSFVKDIPENKENMALTRAIIAMAHSLSLKVVAEGVETVEQMDFLRRHCCAIVQGYHVSRPLSAPDMLSFMCERKSPKASSYMFDI
jgi:diguanylate cyclase (GGDEF)-like protein